MDDSDTLNRIIADCKLGSNHAFSELVDLYADKCYGYFYRLSGNAEVSNDLLSTLFVKLVEKIGSYRGGSFDGWIFTIASNIFRDHLRSVYHRKKLRDAKADQPRIDTITPQQQIDLADQLQNLLEKLDPDVAELLVMRFYGQLSFKELSKLRAEPIGTTLAKVHRGLKKLRTLMEKEHD